MNEIAIHAENLRKTYSRGIEQVHAIDDISLDIRSGEFVSVIGPSGSGKTTLINILGCLDNPTSGRLNIDGKEIFGEGRALSERQMTRIRRERFGYIFQKFYLIPTLTVAENVMLPFTFYRKDGALNNVSRLLDLLGIENRKNHLPGQLSGGEMQRTAIARALVNNPRILLADEPTGNLDTSRSEEIGQVLKELNRQQGITIILVTHNPALAQTAHRAITLHDGKIKI